MRTLNIYTTQQIDSSGIKPTYVLYIPYTTPVYVSNQIITFNGNLTKAWVKDWGNLNESLQDEFNGVKITDLQITFLVKSQDNPNIKTILRDKVNYPYQWLCYLYLHFDYDLAEDILLWAGYIIGYNMEDMLTFKVSFTDISITLQKNLCSMVQSDDFPRLDKDSYGQYHNIIYGQFNNLKCLGLKTGNNTTLAESITTTQMSFNVSFGFGIQSGDILLIDDEKVQVSSIYNNLVILSSRQYKGTKGAEHNKGASIKVWFEKIVYEVSEHVCKSISNVKLNYQDNFISVNEVDTTTVYLGNCTLDSNAYLGRTVIVFYTDTLIAFIRKQLAIQNNLYLSGDVTSTDNLDFKASGFHLVAETTTSMPAVSDRTINPTKVINFPSKPSGLITNIKYSFDWQVYWPNKGFINDYSDDYVDFVIQGIIITRFSNYNFYLDKPYGRFNRGNSGTFVINTETNWITSITIQSNYNLTKKSPGNDQLDFDFIIFDAFIEYDKDGNLNKSGGVDTKNTLDLSGGITANQALSGFTIYVDGQGYESSYAHLVIDHIAKFYGNITSVDYSLVANYIVTNNIKVSFFAKESSSILEYLNQIANQTGIYTKFDGNTLVVKQRYLTESQKTINTSHIKVKPKMPMLKLAVTPKDQFINKLNVKYNFENDNYNGSFTLDYSEGSTIFEKELLLPHITDIAVVDLISLNFINWYRYRKDIIEFVTNLKNIELQMGDVITISGFDADINGLYEVKAINMSLQNNELTFICYEIIGVVPPPF
jgi:hypothetical protein